MADQGSPKGPPVDTCPPTRDGDDTSGPREKALRHPESAVAARERTIQPRARELDGNDIAERESAVAAREEAVLSREDAARLREEAVRAQEELERAKAERERLMIETREANERLVAATRHAQTLSEEAEKANRLKDEFLATVSHELRTPLNAVLGWVRMLAAGHVKGDRVAHAIGTIERNASALAEMIDDLLDVSRIIAGTLEIAHDPVDLIATAHTALDAFKPLAAAKNIDLRFSSEPSCALVSGDAGRLQQVVSNLLANAIKFTPHDGRVDVSIACPGPFVEVVVADTGQGISPEFLPHVFERFRQGDLKPTRRHQGLGLGLAIVRQLVELHEGTVRAESPGPGQGATFTIRIPVLTSTALMERRQERRETPPLPRLDGLHILVVEDHPDSRELMSTVLEQAGASVTAVTSVKQAFEALKTRPPHALVSDIGLPDEDGYALIRRLRRREAKYGGFLPAVALTGYVRDEDRARVLAAGYQAHLPKPVEAAQLTAAIAALTRAPGAVSPRDE